MCAQIAERIPLLDGKLSNLCHGHPKPKAQASISFAEATLPLTSDSNTNSPKSTLAVMPPCEALPLIEHHRIYKATVAAWAHRRPDAAHAPRSDGGPSLVI